MNIDKKSKMFSRIAGVSFIVLAMVQYVIIPIITAGMFFSRGIILKNLFVILCYASMGVIHLLGKSDKLRLRILSVISMIFAVCDIVRLFWSWGQLSSYISKELVVLYGLELIEVSIYVILSVIYWIYSSNITQKKIKMLSWIIYLPPALYFLSAVLTFSMGGLLGNWGNLFLFLLNIFLYILNCTAFMFSGFWLGRVIAENTENFTEIKTGNNF